MHLIGSLVERYAVEDTVGKHGPELCLIDELLSRCLEYSLGRAENIHQMNDGPTTTIRDHCKGYILNGMHSEMLLML